MTRVDSRAGKMVLVGVDLLFCEMHVSLFNWTVAWMAGCWDGRMILTTAKFPDK